jgi:uncharacterized protein YbjT (DUF2867 family)
MSNWKPMLKAARETGKVSVMYPADFAFPMVAPHDLGEAAAKRMLSGSEDVGVRYIQGPKTYSPNDVARVFGQLLGREIDVDVIPRERWEATYRKLGFSEIAATSYSQMVEASINGGFDIPAGSWKGNTTLEKYLNGISA